jgi:transcriptional regulator with XRE-family HTH domain
MFNYSPFHKPDQKKEKRTIMALPIKQHRKKLGLTQKALAAKLGVSVPSVVNWESGKMTPRGKNLAKVEKFLGTKASAPKKAEKKAAAKPKKKAGRPKGKAGRPKKVAPKKKVGRPKGKAGRPKKATPKKKVGRPKKAATKAKAQTKRPGRPKRTAPATMGGTTARLRGVAKDLGFASVDEMVKTILRKHKIGKLDL